MNTGKVKSLLYVFRKLESKKIEHIPLYRRPSWLQMYRVYQIYLGGVGGGGEGRRRGTVVEEARKIEGGARPLGTFETKMAARNGKRSIPMILWKIEDCEQSSTSFTYTCTSSWGTFS